MIQLIYPTTGLQPPITPDLKRKPRLQFLDTGLLTNVLGIQSEMIGLHDLNSFYKRESDTAPCSSAISGADYAAAYKPLFWVRDKANSNAEVDLDISVQGIHYPCRGEIRFERDLWDSLHQFVERSGHRKGIRLLANRFSVEKSTTPAGIPYLLMNMPYCLYPDR